MAKSTTCTVRLSNKTYELKCNDDEAETLQLAAQKLNEHILKKRKSFKQVDEYNVLLMAALQVSHELIDCQNQQEKKRKQLAEFISALESKISQAAEGIFL